VREYFTPFTVLILGLVLICGALDLGSKYLDSRATTSCETKK
jgi:hypothetical protein